MTNQEQEKELIKKPPILDEVKAEIRANLWDVLFKTHQLTICVKPILEAQRDADYEYFLKAIPLISAQVAKRYEADAKQLVEGFAEAQQIAVAQARKQVWAFLDKRKIEADIDAGTMTFKLTLDEFQAALQQREGEG